MERRDLRTVAMHEHVSGSCKEDFCFLNYNSNVMNKRILTLLQTYHTIRPTIPTVFLPAVQFSSVQLRSQASTWGLLGQYLLGGVPVAWRPEILLLFTKINTRLPTKNSLHSCKQVSCQWRPSPTRGWGGGYTQGANLCMFPHL